MSSESAWVSPWWSAAILPRRWEVAGIELASLSVWHVFALQNIGNAYVMRQPADRDAAASLLLIASHSHKDGALLFYNTKHRYRQILKMHRRLKGQDWADTDRACSEYVTTCMRRGHRMPCGSGASVPSGTPEAFSILRVLLPLGIEAAWDTPYAQGRAMLDTADEANGDCIMTPWLYGEHMHDHWAEYEAMTGTRELVIE